jgi:hypothetical protein
MPDVHLDRHRAECERLGCVDFFDHLIEEGNNSGFAAMLAQRRPPGSKGTDRAFLEGTHGWADRMWPVNARNIHSIAKKAGISTQGKIYKGGLGRPNDPMAWISSAGDVLAAAKAKGYTVTGAVNYQAPAQQPKRIKMADDVAHDYMRRELAADPALAEKVKKKPKKLMELKEKVVEKHSK